MVTLGDQGLTTRMGVVSADQDPCLDDLASDSGQGWRRVKKMAEILARGTDWNWQQLNR